MSPVTKRGILKLTYASETIKNIDIVPSVEVIDGTLAIDFESV